MTPDSHILSCRRLSAAPSNKIFILKSLKPEEYDTAEEIHQHIVGNVNAERRNTGESDVVPESVTLESKQHLIDLLKRIEIECQHGVIPIIHLETHGNEAGLGIISPGGKFELINWEELIQLFRRINIACQGNLTIVLAACYSFRIEDLVFKQQLASPFFALIGYEDRVLPDDIHRDHTALYDSLLLKSTLPDDESGLLESGKVYTEYDLAFHLISVLLMNRISPDEVVPGLPTFEQFFEGSPLDPGLSEDEHRQLFDALLKSERVLLSLADFMQNKKNVELLKQDVRLHFQTYFKD